MSLSYAELLPELCRIATEAGEAILPYYQDQSHLVVQQKKDDTPVTQADTAASQVIVDGLAALTPGIPVLSEEENIPDYAERQTWSRYWLVDPLDGTRGFIGGLQEFTVNIALIEDGRSVASVLYVPVTQTGFYAAKGQGAYRWVGASDAEKIQVSHHSTTRVLLGHYHGTKRLQQFFQGLNHYALRRVNSSLKFALLAEGEGDVYPRLGPTSEWDSAAGQIILEEAGGLVVDFQGQPLHYNAKPSLLNPRFLAVANPEFIEHYLSLLAYIEE